MIACLIQVHVKMRGKMETGSIATLSKDFYLTAKREAGTISKE